MTRFSITMNEAVDFILNATKIGKGSEIFIPKLKAYSIQNIKETLFELLENTGEELSGLRPGEKLQETLINADELRYTWEFNGMYMIINPFYQLFNEKSIYDTYSNIKKIEKTQIYSSDNVDKITNEELKALIETLGLLKNNY